MWTTGSDMFTNTHTSLHTHTRREVYAQLGVMCLHTHTCIHPFPPPPPPNTHTHIAKFMWTNGSDMFTNIHIYIHSHIITPNQHTHKHLVFICLCFLSISKQMLLKPLKITHKNTTIVVIWKEECHVHTYTTTRISKNETLSFIMRTSISNADLLHITQHAIIKTTLHTTEHHSENPTQRKG